MGRFPARLCGGPRLRGRLPAVILASISCGIAARWSAGARRGANRCRRCWRRCLRSPSSCGARRSCTAAVHAGSVRDAARELHRGRDESDLADARVFFKTCSPPAGLYVYPAALFALWAGAALPRATWILPRRERRWVAALIVHDPAVQTRPTPIVDAMSTRASATSCLSCPSHSCRRANHLARMSSVARLDHGPVLAPWDSCSR